MRSCMALRPESALNSTWVALAVRINGVEDLLELAELAKLEDVFEDAWFTPPANGGVATLDV